MESMRRFVFTPVIATFISVMMIMLSGYQVRATPGAEVKGPHKTSNSEYRMKPGVDPDILAGQATEIWGRVYWPTDLADPATGKVSKKRPLLMLLHGNHGTCGSGVNPRNDRSCEYTNEGTCPAGSIVTPNHEGYNYAAEHLASWGYVVVSINANRGITCGGGGSDDWGLILARGRLVLKHLQLWNEWSLKGGAPASLGSADQFIGAIDIGNVGLMGHSRGGEGVRAALNLYRDPSNPWVAKIPGLDIKAIYEIGAVDGQSARVLDAPSVAWNQLLPLCDGDVSDLEGRMPFERMMSRFSTKNEAESRPSPKSLTMVWGANHNYFNTEWQTSDAYGCSGAPTHKPIFDDNKIESLEQQAIALQSMTAFFRANVGPDKISSLGQSFDPAFELPKALSSVGRIDRDFIPALELTKVLRVDDFTEQTGKNPNGPQNEAMNVTVKHDGNAEPPVANVQWTQSGSDRYFQTNFANTAKGVNITSFDFLDFRVGRIMQDPEQELANLVDFSVQLVADDNTVSQLVPISNYTRLQGPPSDGTELTQTVRLPIASFGPFKLAKARGDRFVFDKTAKAKIRLAHVRFGVSAEKISGYGTMSLAEIQPIARAAALLNGNSVPAMDTIPAETTPPELILPNTSNGPPQLLSTPFELPGPRVRNSTTQRRASWMKPRKISRSRQLQGEAAIEMMIETQELFPVMDSLPVLNIENHLFPISRYPSNGKTHALIFTVPQEAYELLPSIGRAQVQYGLKAPSRVWELPNFSKSNTNEELEIE